MPSTVAALLQSAGLTWDGAVRWGTEVPLNEPGVYLVSSSSLPDATEGPATPQISDRALDAMLSTRPELLLDGHRPTINELADRLRSMWLPGETVLYIGLAGTSTAKRVKQYSLTPLGARSPHSGGWPIQTLADLDRKWVHYAACAEPDIAEQSMLDTFMANVSIASRAAACDDQLPLPFANLKDPRGPRKRHGITGARAPRSRHPLTALAPAAPGQRPETSTTFRTQRVTTPDLAAGRIRIPKESKPLFPSCKADVLIMLQGKTFDVRWDPRTDPDRERSGVLSVGRAQLARVAYENDVLVITTQPDGTISIG